MERAGENDRDAGLLPAIERDVELESRDISRSRSIRSGAVRESHGARAVSRSGIGVAMIRSPTAEPTREGDVCRCWRAVRRGGESERGKAAGREVGRPESSRLSRPGVLAVPLPVRVHRSANAASLGTATFDSAWHSRDRSVPSIASYRGRGPFCSDRDRTHGGGRVSNLDRRGESPRVLPCRLELPRPGTRQMIRGC